MNIFERARKKKGLSRSQMARDLKWAESTLQRYEKKEMIPRVTKALEMAEYLDLDIKKVARYFKK